MMQAHNIVGMDLEYIWTNLQQEFSRLAGKSLLITGGAGFLGYYLVQSVLYWNRDKTAAQSIRVTIFDN